MKKIWVNKAGSFEDAERFDDRYYSNMSSSERLEIVQFLREEYYKIKGKNNAGRERLRRSVKVIQQK